MCILIHALHVRTYVPGLDVSDLLQDTYIQERADAMQNIEQTIVELGGIFKQLAVMVKEQEEQVMRYETI